MAFKIPNFAKQMGGSPFRVTQKSGSPFHVTPDPEKKSDDSSSTFTGSKPTARVGTQERVSQYKALGWALDDTTPGDHDAWKNSKYNKSKKPSDNSNESKVADEAPKSDDKKEHKPAEGVKVKSRKEKRAAKRVARLSAKNKKKGLTKGQSKRLSRNISKAKGEKVKDEDKTNVGKAIKKGVEKVKKVVNKKKNKQTEDGASGGDDKMTEE
tara:strand:- start:55 stop:687 length:633 start_codon:yes stop_codon:yes gene_type:complete